MALGLDHQTLLQASWSHTASTHTVTPCCVLSTAHCVLQAVRCNVACFSCCSVSSKLSNTAPQNSHSHFSGLPNTDYTMQGARRTRRPTCWRCDSACASCDLCSIFGFPFAASFSCSRRHCCCCCCCFYCVPSTGPSGCSGIASTGQSSGPIARLHCSVQQPVTQSAAEPPRSLLDPPRLHPDYTSPPKCTNRSATRHPSAGDALATARAISLDKSTAVPPRGSATAGCCSRGELCNFSSYISINWANCKCASEEGSKNSKLQQRTSQLHSAANCPHRGLLFSFFATISSQLDPYLQSNQSIHWRTAR